MIVTAHQPHYLPWIGYINRISLADVFVLMDNMIYTRYNYINRNRIASKSGILNISVPIKHNSKLQNKISQIEISYPAGRNWIYKHLKSIEHNYSSALAFNTFFPLLEKILLQKHTYLYQLDLDLLIVILKYLDIKTKIVLASDKDICGDKSDDLFLSLLNKTNSNTILLGLGASTSYSDKDAITKESYSIAFQKYTHQIYTQNTKSFINGISIIDLLLNVEQQKAIEIVRKSGTYELY